MPLITDSLPAELSVTVLFMTAACVSKSHVRPFGEKRTPVYSLGVDRVLVFVLASEVSQQHLSQNFVR